MNLEQPVISSRFKICDRHPDEPLTGFCASCLRERLAGLDSTTTSSSTSSHRKISTTTTAAASSTLKSIYRGSTAVDNRDPSSSSVATSSSSFLPELRRCKSFSGRQTEGLSGGFEPKRKSCDVRGFKPEICREGLVETRNFEDIGVGDQVIESRGYKEEIGGLNVSDFVEVIEEEEEEEEVIEEEEEVIEEEEETVTMKDHLYKDFQNKKPAGKDIAGSFRSAASVFSKKLQKWRGKQKLKKSETGGLSTKQADKPNSEITDYGYGRRSSDIDPRFSLDIGRMSMDGPRYSLDEPRASWDGYLIGKTFPRLAPMVSVVEDVPIPVTRSDDQIPVEETMNSVDGDDNITPGGTTQTRDYYSDTSQRRRRSFDRSNSARRRAAAVGVENEDANSKVSPSSVHLFHGARLVTTDRDQRDLRSNSLRDDRSESFESTSRDSASVSCNVDQKGSKKSSKRWRNIWGLIHKRSVGNKDDEEERFNNRGNVVQRSLSESWQDLRKIPNNGESKPGGIHRFLRSNSSVSSRNSTNLGGAFGGGGMKNVADINGFGKKRKEVVLERTRSARYSSSEVVDNGLLRFYLTPLRNKRSLSGNGRPRNPPSIARRILGLY